VAAFGVLTEIDMQHTLRSKIDKDIDRSVILGACNPNWRVPHSTPGSWSR
jgi:uncharacterized protein (DUF302 family)